MSEKEGRNVKMRQSEGKRELGKEKEREEKKGTITSEKRI